MGPQFSFAATFVALMALGEQYELYTASFCSLLALAVKIPATVIQYRFSESLLNSLNVCSSFRGEDTKFHTHTKQVELELPYTTLIQQILVMVK